MLDTSRGVLLENDAEVVLRPQSVQVLQILLENHGRLVSKEELHDRVWGQKAVTDDSLKQCLVDIRRALHDTERTLIRTLPRRGYSFEADVNIEPIRDDADKAARSFQLLRPAVLAAALLVATWFGWTLLTDSDPTPSIAVLPFDDLGSAQNLQYVGDGLAEDILNTLAYYPEISVVARTSSFAYSTGSNDIKTIARALDVDYVVEGSVRDAGDEAYRVVAQLIDADSGSHVWSKTYEAGIADLAAVHEQISTEVLTRIAPGIEIDKVRVVVPGFTADELILIARDSERKLRDLNDVDPELLANAIERYRNATTVNPGSAKAQAGLARVLLIQGDLQGARLAVEAAVEANSSLSEVQEVRGRYLWLTGQPGAGEAWEQAVQLGPNDVNAVGSYGYWLWMQGQLIAAEPYLVKALDLDPGSLSRYADLGNYLGNETRIDDLLQLVELIRERFDSAESFRVIAHLLDMIGRTDESIAWLAMARNADPDNPIYSWALAELFADIGDYATAERLDPGPGLGLLLKMGRYPEFIDSGELQMIEDPADLALRYMLAFAYNVTGEHRLAIYHLESARVLDYIQPEVRQALDLEAAYVWIDAMYATGQAEQAEGTVQFIATKYTEPAADNWWRYFHSACLDSLRGFDERALDGLEEIPRGPRLPLLYLVRDARCVQKFKDNARFTGVIEAIEVRQQAIRQQVPATLERLDVSLPELVVATAAP